MPRAGAWAYSAIRPHLRLFSGRVHVVVLYENDLYPVLEAFTYLDDALYEVFTRLVLGMGFAGVNYLNPSLAYAGQPLRMSESSKSALLYAVARRANPIVMVS